VHAGTSHRANRRGRLPRRGGAGRSRHRLGHAQAEALKAQHELQLANIAAARMPRCRRPLPTSRKTPAIWPASTACSRPDPPPPRPARSSTPCTRSSPPSSSKPRHRRMPPSASSPSRRARAAGRGGHRRAARQSRGRQAQSQIHHHRRDPGRRHRPAPGEARTVCRRRQPDHHARAAAECLGDRQLQGNSAHAHGGGPESRDHRRYLSRPYAAKAISLAFAPASGAQFALLPPDNATGNFTKIVQRVAVKILIDDPDGLPIAWSRACRWRPESTRATGSR
jgi:hypothetical protein